MLVVVYFAGKTWRGFPGLCNLVLRVLGVVGLLYDAWLIVTFWCIFPIHDTWLSVT